jgi:hypothetical protein
MQLSKNADPGVLQKLHRRERERERENEEEMNESMKERTIEFFVAPKNVNKKRRCEIE